MSCEAGWSKDGKHKKLYITTYWYHDKSGELYGFGSSQLEHQYQDTILLELCCKFWNGSQFVNGCLCYGRRASFVKFQFQYTMNSCEFPKYWSKELREPVTSILQRFNLTCGLQIIQPHHWHFFGADLYSSHWHVPFPLMWWSWAPAPAACQRFNTWYRVFH